MYAQHVDCVAKSVLHPVSHSNTFLSRFFNLTTFNIGYHIEHHDYPAVHWSELPAFHQRLKNRLIEGGAHVLPFGYYRAGWYRERLMRVNRNAESNRPEFAAQHPDYVLRQTEEEIPAQKQSCNCNDVEDNDLRGNFRGTWDIAADSEKKPERVLANRGNTDG